MFGIPQTGRHCNCSRIYKTSGNHCEYPMDVFYQVSVFWRSKLIGTEGPAATHQTLLINRRAEVAADNHCREYQSNRDERKYYDRFSHSWFLGVLQSPSLAFVFINFALIYSTPAQRRKPSKNAFSFLYQRCYIDCMI